MIIDFIIKKDLENFFVENWVLDFYRVIIISFSEIIKGSFFI